MVKHLEPKATHPYKKYIFVFQCKYIPQCKTLFTQSKVPTTNIPPAPLTAPDAGLYEP